MPCQLIVKARELCKIGRTVINSAFECIKIVEIRFLIKRIARALVKRNIPVLNIRRLSECNRTSRAHRNASRRAASTCAARAPRTSCASPFPAACAKQQGQRKGHDNSTNLFHALQTLHVSVPLQRQGSSNRLIFPFTRGAYRPRCIP